MNDYRKYARELTKTVSELQEKVLEKHTAAVLEEMHDQIMKYKNQYNDLIMQVVNKIPGESRHETAKRIIQQAESHDSGPAQEAQ